MTYPLIASHTTNFRSPRRGDIKWIVLHTTESDIGPVGEGDRGAEQTARDFQNPDLNVSSHFVTDDDSTVQCVSLMDEAFTNGPWNRYTVTIEQEGRAAVTDWTTTHNGLLNQTAKLLAYLYDQLGIPLRFVTGQEIVNAVVDKQSWPKGVTTHVELNNATRLLGVQGIAALGLGNYTPAKLFSLSSHTDPGANFPVDEVLRRARLFIDLPVSQEDSMKIYVIEPMNADGTPTGAKFRGVGDTSSTGTFALDHVVHLSSDDYSWYKDPQHGWPSRSLPYTDLKGVMLLGALPPDQEKFGGWTRDHFAQVIG